ncbi:hypothetical protein Hesp01_03680 [Herbidospora sp. NBRC 101105]|nr:hypothetical protein Hesp01_03680 [Herbidospora sp. NBRC 101105]
MPGSGDWCLTLKSPIRVLLKGLRTVNTAGPQIKPDGAESTESFTFYGRVYARVKLPDPL